jgi:hypothetical protein
MVFVELAFHCGPGGLSADTHARDQHMRDGWHLLHGVHASALRGRPQKESQLTRLPSKMHGTSTSILATAPPPPGTANGAAGGGIRVAAAGRGGGGTGSASGCGKECERATHSAAYTASHTVDAQSAARHGGVASATTASSAPQHPTRARSDGSTSRDATTHPYRRPCRVRRVRLRAARPGTQARAAQRACHTNRPSGA